MRIKVVPAPADRALLAEVHEALPLVPDSVEDCCRRIRDRTTIPSRDEAREWLTFAEALGLAAETERGFHRVRDPPEGEALERAFVESIFGAREIVAATADVDGSLTQTAAFEAIRDEVPRWERNRYSDWEGEWRERVGRLLAWGVEVGALGSGGEGDRRT
jgi:hypothetical protein